MGGIPLGGGEDTLGRTPMKSVVRFVVGVVGYLSLTALGLAQVATGVHLSYHWHLHQPIYWPETAPGTNRYQYGHDSVLLKTSNTGNFYPGSIYRHPRNQLVNGDGGEFDVVFDKDDRKQAYQFRGRDAIASLGAHADGGASVSYSGSLMENIGSFGRASAYGYGPNWKDGYTEARGWTTRGGFPKADMVGMTFHHSFSPLLPRSVLRKEIEIFREIWWKTWGGQGDKSDHSKGFWPIEAAFSRHLVPILREYGYEWVIVANSHLARTVPNYLEVAQRGNSGWNIDPPNRADQLGPVVPANQWFNGTRDARGGTFPVPFAYQTHRLRQADPTTGEIFEMVVVPMCDYLSYENGYASMGTGVIDAEIAPYNDPARPALVLFAHDGDNAWGGGASYYLESVPNLMNEAAAKGYRPTTIQQFLADHPVPPDAYVHVEDGAWVNADNDWGHPLFINWLYPPTRAPSDPAYRFNDPRTWFDLETPGWTEDWRNWAVLMAATNVLETAEQIWKDNGGSVQSWKIQEPTQSNGTNNEPNAVEQAWHYFLGGLDSGFMYYGISLDDEVKQTLASNRALAFAKPVLALGLDRTPPTVFKPQRFPWNPGGRGWGPLTGYQPVGFDGNPPYSSDFHVWSHVFDISGVTRVTLKVRVDADGVNALETFVNETYAGGAGVGTWIEIPMTRRTVPKGNVTNNPQVEFFLEPEEIADYWFAKVEGFRNVLLDYYIEAEDTLGQIQRSDIQHVFVEDDGTAPSAPAPATGLGAAPAGEGEIALGWQAGAGASRYQINRDGEPLVEVTALSYLDTDLEPAREYCYTVVARNGVGDAAGTAPACAPAGLSAPDPGFPTTPPPFVLDGAYDFAGYLRSNPGMTVYAAVRGTKLYLATWSPGNSGPSDHFLLLAPALLESATTPAPWAKAGFTALPTDHAYVGAESNGTFIGAVNLPTTAQVVKAASNAGQMELVVDLVEAFGQVPPMLYVASAAYGTNNGDALAAQAPAGNGDGNIDADEFLALPLVSMLDRFGNGTYDRLDPKRAFHAGVGPAPEGGLRIVWNAQPGSLYQIEISADLNVWTPVGEPILAGPTDVLREADLPAAANSTSFIRVALLPPPGT